MSASLPSWARRGMKVVCVEAIETAFDGAILGSDTPIVGGVYTISWAGFTTDGYAVVDVTASYTQGWCYDVEHFRPAVPRKTEAEDTAYFRKLIDQPVGEDA